MNPAIPAPGGSVGLKTFAIYLAGGSLGIYAYANHLTQVIPDSWEQWSLGPISGTTVWFCASALVGAALAAKVAGAHK